MKNLKKILAVMTSVAAICTSMTAFAAEASTSFTPNGVTDVFTFTYDNETGTISKLALGDAVLAGDVTILVTNPDVARQNVGEDDILYIDQSTKADGFNASMGLRNAITFTEAEMAGTEAVKKTVPVYVGYTSETGFTIANGNITAVYTPASGETTVTILWGDLTGDGTINSADAVAAIYGSLDMGKTYGKYTVGKSYSGILWGDLTGDGTINSADAVAAIYGSLDMGKTYGKYTVGTEYELNLTEDATE